MDARYIAVLEIGSSKVKGAVARYDSDGTTIVATHEVPTLNCVRHGRVLNVQDVSARVDEVLRRLENHPDVAPRRIRRVRIALGGRSLSSHHASTDVHLPSEADITTDIVERLKRDIMNSQPADRHILAVLPRNFTVNGAKVTNPVGMVSSDIHADTTVLTATPVNRTNLDRVRLASGGENPKPVERIYVPRQLALARMALSPSEQQLGVVLVDMGSETTTLSIHRSGVVHAVVTLPMGGRNITRDIATALSITEEQAEYIKVNQASAIPDPQNDTTPEAREVSSYTQARAGEIIANILHRISQAGFKPADLPSGIVLTGRASRMKRLIELFETQTKMHVRIAPADHSVSPGDTGIDPVDSLDIMALTAWPVPEADGESDLTEVELPRRRTVEEDESDEYPRTYDPRKAANNAGWRAREALDDDNVLKDDDEVESELQGRQKRAERDAQRQQRRRDTRNITTDIDDDDEDDDSGKAGDTGRYSGLRALITKIGNNFMGTKGPDDIDD